MPVAVISVISGQLLSLKSVCDTAHTHTQTRAQAFRQNQQYAPENFQVFNAALCLLSGFLLHCVCLSFWFMHPRLSQSIFPLAPLGQRVVHLLFH